MQLQEPHMQRGTAKGQENESNIPVMIEHITIAHGLLTPGTMLRIMGVDGRQMMTQKVADGAPQTSLNVNGLPKGIYLLQMEASTQRVDFQRRPRAHQLRARHLQSTAYPVLKPGPSRWLDQAAQCGLTFRRCQRS